jgi:hypothetical protein
MRSTKGKPANGYRHIRWPVFCHVTFDVDLLQSESANRARPPIARGTALAQIIHEGIGANLDRMTNDQGSGEHSTHRHRLSESPHLPLVICHWDVVIPARIARCLRE